MNAEEFVAKAAKDRDFLVEVYKHVPDEMISEETP